MSRALRADRAPAGSVCLRELPEKFSWPLGWDLALPWRGGPAGDGLGAVSQLGAGARRESQGSRAPQVPALSAPGALGGAGGGERTRAETAAFLPANSS